MKCFHGSQLQHMNDLWKFFLSRYTCSVNGRRSALTNNVTIMFLVLSFAASINPSNPIYVPCLSCFVRRHFHSFGPPSFCILLSALIRAQKTSYVNWCFSSNKKKLCPEKTFRQHSLQVSMKLKWKQIVMSRLEVKMGQVFSNRFHTRCVLS